ncbi:hypothetical protein AUJ77_02075 [Candidatus Nomurabacteria bacterium CG1_02_43_90]|uniref:DUF1003 domain-containing protein n=1 Tax=Candidatus Nomurabacteria bacterium CG1_02_43_90 TaxID=1805281 RepID=A0A1J4V616_9BACT|nr:MAG: hypothetical protein AUJ77_02075 [Candidatus Nomurabacteria bacterium CG1_02_43_90]
MSDKKITGPQETRLEKIAIAFTNWIGSIQSLFVHTLLFIGTFVLAIMGVPLATVLLVLTTVVSLEAIYLAIFIQMSVNRNSAQLREVEKDIDEIQEDVEEISEDVEEIQEDVEEISEDIEEIQEEEKEEDREEELEKKKNAQALTKLEKTLTELLKEIDALKKK